MPSCSRQPDCVTFAGAAVRLRSPSKVAAIGPLTPPPPPGGLLSSQGASHLDPGRPNDAGGRLPGEPQVLEQSPCVARFPPRTRQRRRPSGFLGWSGRVEPPDRRLDRLAGAFGTIGRATSEAAPTRAGSGSCRSRSLIRLARFGSCEDLACRQECCLEPDLCAASLVPFADEELEPRKIPESRRRHGSSARDGVGTCRMRLRLTHVGPAPFGSVTCRDGFHNAVEAGSVHETVSMHAEATGTSPAHTLAMDNEVGTAEGRQIIDVDGAHATVIVIGTKAFIEGNAQAMANYFQVSKTDPQRFAGRWLSISESDPGYATVSAAVTLKSDFSGVSLKGPLKKGTVIVIGGQEALPISGYIAGPSAGEKLPATLYVTTTGKVLPIELRASGSHVSKDTSWSDWGHVVSFVAPAGAVSISSLGG
jgi:hypothetical protein